MKNTKLFLKWIEEKREEVGEKIQEAHKQARGLASGRHYAVELYKDGDILVNGSFSSGEQTISSWEGESYVIACLKSWDVDNVDYEEELKGFDEKLYCEFLSSEYRREGRIEGAYRFLYENRPEVLEEIENNIAEYIIDDYDCDTDIEQAIKELIDIIDYESKEA